MYFIYLTTSWEITSASGCDQVRLKLDCSATETSYSLDILHLASLEKYQPSESVQVIIFVGYNCKSAGTKGRGHILKVNKNSKFRILNYEYLTPNSDYRIPNIKVHRLPLLSHVMQKPAFAWMRPGKTQTGLLSYRD